MEGEISIPKSKSPLVSVIVITYNSFEYVIEALESIKAQIYQNIELLISDDGSTDGTIKICSGWLENNKDRFVRTEMIVSEYNTGISANCNRGLVAAKGEWIKLIAGDDFLDPDILSKQIEYVKSHEVVKFLWTNVGIFYDKPSGERKITVPLGISDLRINSKDITADEQFQITLRSNPVFTAGIILKKEIFETVGLYDESYKMYEDLPFIHNVLLKGIKLHYLDIVGAYYRKHDNSVQVGTKKQLRNYHHIDVYKYQLTVAKHYTNFFERNLRKMVAQYNLFYTSRISNTKNFVNKLLLYTPTIILRRIIILFANQHS